MGLGHGASHWITGTFFLLLPKVREEFGFSYAEISLIGSIYYFGSFVSNVVSGPAVDMSGRRILFQVASLFLVGLAMVGFGLIHGFVLLALMGVLISAANCIWHPAAMSFLSSEYPNNRAFVLSLHGIGSNVGEAVGPVATALEGSGVAVGIGVGVSANVYALGASGAQSATCRGGPGQAAQGAQRRDRRQYGHGVALGEPGDVAVTGEVAAGIAH